MLMSHKFFNFESVFRSPSLMFLNQSSFHPSVSSLNEWTESSDSSTTLYAAVHVPDSLTRDLNGMNDMMRWMMSSQRNSREFGFSCGMAFAATSD